MSTPEHLAHLTDFLVGGQGIASGFRDAIGLAWRLALACRGYSPNYQTLFRGWFLERKQQLDASLAATVRNGEMVNGKSLVHDFTRNWGLWFVQLIPNLKHWLELGPRANGPMRYTFLPGMPFMPEFAGGLCFPQTYCISLQPNCQLVHFTDDVIFGEKSGMFQLVVLDDAEELGLAINDLKETSLHRHLILPTEATYFVPRLRCETKDSRIADVRHENLYRTATSDEFARSPLCKDRPSPQGYNETLMWSIMKGKRYVILRFDRFVFAACKDREELESAFRRLSEMFGG